MDASQARAQPLQAGPLGFSDGQLELLKWLAMGSMFIDHVGRHLLGWGQDTWVFAAGRLAFPLFALVLGLNLARPGDQAGRALRTARRLALWCAVSQWPAAMARGEPWMVNVLGTLALGALLCWCVASGAHVAVRIAACAAAAAASTVVEFGPAGVFLVAAVFLAVSLQQPGVAVVAALLFLLTGDLNASFGGWLAMLGTLAVVPVASLVRALPVGLPRWQLGFYLVYPVHLALIGWRKGAPLFPFTLP